jgi:PTH1 family peptidyl-tRNA hydrolase
MAPPVSRLFSLGVFFLCVKITNCQFIGKKMFFQKIFGKKVEKETFLIVGLGNPGRDYRLNRHNIGFRAVDHLAKAWGITLGSVRNKALIGQGQFGDVRVILVKPQTFMNLSGQSVSSLVRFYKIPLEKMLVTYDDLDLPLGTLRLRENGGSAGHKGMISIIGLLGSNAFPRLRLGIGRPAGRMPVEAYVLQDFTDKEEELLSSLFDRSVEAVEVFIDNGINLAMTQFNGSLL